MRLQDVVDELAAALGRSVVINGLDYAPLAASAQGDEIDHLRAHSLLQRATPVLAREYLETLHLEQANRPVTVQLAAFHGRERLAVPIRNDDGPLGLLWLITGDLPPFTVKDYAAIDAAVVLAREVLGGDLADAGGSERTDVLAALLSEEAEARREAFSVAVRRGWLERGGQTVVRALLTDDGASSIARTAFGRFLASLRPSPQFVVGERDAALLVVGRRVDHGIDLDGLIVSEAARLGIRVLGIGTAHHDRATDDLAETARHASTAARLSASFPEFQPSVDITAVGAWALLASAPFDPSVLGVASPAAAALRSQPDSTQLRTIETYLDVGGNVRRACELLHIHRTTLYYRLENMPDVVTRALDDGLQRSALHLTLKLARLWDAGARV